MSTSAARTGARSAASQFYRGESPWWQSRCWAKWIHEIYPVFHHLPSANAGFRATCAACGPGALAVERLKSAYAESGQPLPCGTPCAPTVECAPAAGPAQEPLAGALVGAGGLLGGLELDGLAAAAQGVSAGTWAVIGAGAGLVVLFLCFMLFRTLTGGGSEAGRDALEAQPQQQKQALKAPPGYFEEAGKPQYAHKVSPARRSGAHEQSHDKSAGEGDFVFAEGQEGGRSEFGKASCVRDGMPRIIRASLWGGFPV